MSNTRTYTLSDETVQAQKAYQKRKSQAKQYIWKNLKLKHPDVFYSLISEFNSQFDTKVSKLGDI